MRCLISFLPEQLDCSLRSLALEYGASLFRPADNSHASRESRSRLYDALNLKVCPNKQKKFIISNMSNVHTSRTSVWNANVPSIFFYVSVANGVDTNTGTSPAKPFRTIARAQKAARIAAAVPGQAVTIFLRGGIYFGSPPSSSGEALLHLTPEDNGASATARVTYASYPGEEAVLSGGVSLQGLRWDVLNGSHSSAEHAVYRAVVPLHLVPAGESFTGLFGGNISIAGSRLTRARYPNCADIAGTDCFRLNASSAIKGRVTSPTEKLFEAQRGSENLNVVNQNGFDMFAQGTPDAQRRDNSWGHGASDGFVREGNLTVTVQHPDWGWRCNEVCVCV